MMVNIFLLCVMVQICVIQIPLNVVMVSPSDKGHVLFLSVSLTGLRSMLGSLGFLANIERHGTD